jgi:hypothetical protein
MFASTTRILAARHLQELLVLVADEFDQFRAVDHDRLLDSYREGPGIGLGIVNGEVDVQVAEVHAPEPLRQPQRVGERAAVEIQPPVGGRVAEGAAEVVRIDDQRVAVPPADRIAVPVRLRLTLLRQRAAVRVDRANHVVRLVDHDRLVRQLDDLLRLRVQVEHQWALREAEGIRVFEPVPGEAFLHELARPGLIRQPALHAGPEILERRERRLTGRRHARFLRARRPHPDARQVRPAVRRARRRCRHVDLAIRRLRHSRFGIERPLRGQDR